MADNAGSGPPQPALIDAPDPRVGAFFFAERKDARQRPDELDHELAVPRDQFDLLDQAAERLGSLGARG